MNNINATFGLLEIVVKQLKQKYKEYDFFYVHEASHFRVYVKGKKLKNYILPVFKDSLEYITDLKQVIERDIMEDKNGNSK